MILEKFSCICLSLVANVVKLVDLVSYRSWGYWVELFITLEKESCITWNHCMNDSFIPLIAKFVVGLRWLWQEPDKMRQITEIAERNRAFGHQALTMLDIASTFGESSQDTHVLISPWTTGKQFRRSTDAIKRYTHSFTIFYDDRMFCTCNCINHVSRLKCRGRINFIRRSCSWQLRLYSFSFCYLLHSPFFLIRFSLHICSKQKWIWIIVLKRKFSEKIKM